MSLLPADLLKGGQAAAAPPPACAAAPPPAPKPRPRVRRPAAPAPPRRRRPKRRRPPTPANEIYRRASRASGTVEPDKRGEPFREITSSDRRARGLRRHCARARRLLRPAPAADARAAPRAPRAAGEPDAAPGLPQGPPGGHRRLLRRARGDPILGRDARPAARRARTADVRPAPRIGRERPPAADARIRSGQGPQRPGAAPLDARAAHERGGAAAARSAGDETWPSRSPPRASRRPSRQDAPTKAGWRARAGDRPPRPATPAGDPGEDAYTQGFHLWEAGQYDEAIARIEVVRRGLSQAPPGELRQQPHRPLAARARASRATPPPPSSPIIATIRRASARPTACSISARR